MYPADDGGESERRRGRRRGYFECAVHILTCRTRVMLEGVLAIRLLDLVVGRRLADSEQLVVVLTLALLQLQLGGLQQLLVLCEATNDAAVKILAQSHVIHGM